MKTENRGGKRTASPGKKIGRPTKEPTRVLNFRVPVKEYDRLKVLLSEYLASLLNVSVAKRKVCPQCKREFDHTEVPSGIFCCYACEYGY